MRAWIAIIAPIFVVGFWTAHQAWVSAYGDLVELPVRGYDSRDLLSGHYLKYRVDYGKYPICKKRTRERKWRVCTCLEVVGPDRRAMATWSGECGERPQWGCALWLRGYCFYDRFIANIERFYVPEKYASDLTNIPPGASIYARLNGNGTAVVTDFLVQGKSIVDFAEHGRGRALQATDERAPANDPLLPGEGTLPTSPKDTPND